MDDEGIQIVDFPVEMHKSRKNRPCDGYCEKEIQKGEIYCRKTTLIDGKFHHVVVHRYNCLLSYY